MIYEGYKSQKDFIYKWLKMGNSITPLEALQKCGCFRLSAVIFDLKYKYGMRIKTEIIYEGRKRYAKYSLENE